MFKLISNFFSKLFIKKQKTEIPQTFQEFVDYKKIGGYCPEIAFPNCEKDNTRIKMVNKYIKRNKIKRGTLIFRSGKVIEPFPEFTKKLSV